MRRCSSSAAEEERWSLVKEGWEINGGDEVQTDVNWISDLVGRRERMSKMTSWGRLKMEWRVLVMVKTRREMGMGWGCT